MLGYGGVYQCHTPTPAALICHRSPFHLTTLYINQRVQFGSTRGLP
jgi:hypothetical protein